MRPQLKSCPSARITEKAGVLDGLHCQLGPLPADDIELLVLKLLGRDEELLQPFPDRLCQITRVL
jgi:hypothetical protein